MATGERELRRQRFKELVASGMGDEEAFTRAKEEARQFSGVGQRLQDRIPVERLSQEPVLNEPGPWDEVETVGRMSREGIIGDWGSEAKGILGATGREVADWVTPGPGKPWIENYREIRDEDEARNEELRRRNPDLASISQLGGAFVTGVATGGMTAAPASVGQAMGQGLAYGVTSGLGASDADLTQGEWGETGEALKDMGTAGLVGTITGGAGHKVMGRLINGPKPKKPPTSKIQKAAAQAAKKVDLSAPSGIGSGRPNIDRFLEGEALEASINKRLDTPDDPFRFTPAQKMGDPELFQVQANAQKYDDVLRLSEQEAKKQQLQVSDLLNKQVDDLAANPAKLGRGNVGRDLAQGIDEVTKSIVTTRKVVTTPILDEAIALSQSYGEMPNIAWPHGREVARRWFIEGQEALSPLSQERAADLVRLLGNKQITLKQMQGALADYGDEAALSGKLFADIDSAKARRFASEMRSALLKDLDALAKKDTYVGAAGQRLQDFHREYKKYSDQIDEIDTRVVKQILNVEAGGAADAVTLKVAKAEPEEISFVVELLGRSKPERVQQLRAQVLDDISVAVGKAHRADAFARAQGQSNIEYSKLDDFFYTASNKLDALYAGDPKAQLALAELRDMTQHLAYKPAQVRKAEAGMANTAAEAAIRGVGWKAGGIPAGTSTGMWNVLKNLWTNEKNIAQALSTPEGIDYFNQVIRMRLQGPEDVPVEEMQKIMYGLTQLGVNLKEYVSANIQQRNDKKPAYGKER